MGVAIVFYDGAKEVVHGGENCEMFGVEALAENCGVIDGLVWELGTDGLPESLGLDGEGSGESLKHAVSWGVGQICRGTVSLSGDESA